MNMKSKMLKSLHYLSFLTFSNVLHVYGSVRAIPTYRVYQLNDVLNVLS